jgi:N4-gp56 family major capsid protein
MLGVVLHQVQKKTVTDTILDNDVLNLVTLNYTFDDALANFEIFYQAPGDASYTQLKKNKAPFFEGNKYVAVIHPSVTYDLRSSKDWNEVHKYAATREIFEGEIGELHGVRFIETTEAPIVIQGSGSSAFAVYLTLFFGKDAFGVVDPEGMGMEMIIKSQEQVGGPLNQFSTVGYKFENAAKILYQERMLRVESASFYSTVDQAN